MAEEIARLVAVVEANIAGFTKGMANAQRIADQRLGAMEKRINQADKKFGTAFRGDTLSRNLTRWLSVAAITAFTRSVVNAAERLSNTAAQIGVTTQQLQELQFAARQTGGSADAISGALSTLNDRLGDAARGEGELAEVMRELKIPMGDAYQVLLSLADATASAATQADKARIATAAFGRAGQQNISFLNQSAAGIRAMADEAHRLNQVWDAETVERLNSFKNSFESLAASFTNIAAGPMSHVLSGLSAFIDDLSRGDWQDSLQALARFFTLGAVDRPVTDTIGKIRELMREQEEIRRMPDSTMFPGVNQLREGRIAVLQHQIDELKKGWLPSSTMPGIPSRGAPPPPRPGGSVESRQQMLDRIGLKDVTSDEFWQLAADRAARIYANEFMATLGAENFVPPEMLLGDMPDRIGIDTQDLGELNTEFDDLTGATDELRNGLLSIGLAAAHGFGDMEDAASRALSRLGDMIVEIGILRPLLDFLLGGTGSSGGGFLGKLFAGVFASGGTIPRGQWGIVGDRGPEPIRATAAGIQVMPNSALRALPAGGRGGAVVNVYQSFPLNGAMGDAGVHAIARQHAAEAAAGTFRAVRSAMPGMIVEAHKRTL